MSNVKTWTECEPVSELNWKGLKVENPVRFGAVVDSMNRITLFIETDKTQVVLGHIDVAQLMDMLKEHVTT